MPAVYKGQRHAGVVAQGETSDWDVRWTCLVATFGSYTRYLIKPDCLEEFSDLGNR